MSRVPRAPFTKSAPPAALDRLAASRRKVRTLRTEEWFSVWRLIPVEIAARAPRVLKPGLGHPELKISLLQCSPDVSHRLLSHALGVGCRNRNKVEKSDRVKLRDAACRQ